MVTEVAAALEVPGARAGMVRAARSLSAASTLALVER
jgi:hypothetical protein